MKSCANCKKIVQALRGEIEELLEQEQGLKRLNDALVEAVSESERQWGEENKWKVKYNQQVVINR